MSSRSSLRRDWTREMKDDKENSDWEEEREDGFLVESYSDFKLRTSKSDIDLGTAPLGLEGACDIVGLLGPVPARKERSRLEANLAARASGEGMISQRGLRAEMMERASGEVNSEVSGAEVAMVDNELWVERGRLRVEAMQTSSQLQNVMLMDELMVTQSENADLKNQLRLLKK